MTLTCPYVLAGLRDGLTLEHGRRVKRVPLIERHARTCDIDEIPEYRRRLRVVYRRTPRRRRICFEDCLVYKPRKGPHAGHSEMVVRVPHMSHHLDAELIRFKLGVVVVGQYLVIGLAHGRLIVGIPVPLLRGDGSFISGSDIGRGDQRICLRYRWTLLAGNRGTKGLAGFDMSRGGCRTTKDVFVQEMLRLGMSIRRRRAGVRHRRIRKIWMLWTVNRGTGAVPDR
jgi:hypothetical protein